MSSGEIKITERRGIKLDASSTAVYFVNLVLERFCCDERRHIVLLHRALEIMKSVHGNGGDVP